MVLTGNKGVERDLHRKPCDDDRIGARDLGGANMKGEGHLDRSFSINCSAAHALIAHAQVPQLTPRQNVMRAENIMPTYRTLLPVRRQMLQRASVEGCDLTPIAHTDQ